jgi:hypothetical protein
MGFLVARHRRRFPGIDADAYHLEVVADLTRQDTESTGKAAQALEAQHRASVVHKRQHDRPLTEVLSKLNSPTCFVAEFGVKRQRLIQILIEPDFEQR